MDILVVAVVTAALGGAAFGFLFYNFNPARIFMGDTGSMFLGFMLSGISVVGVMKSAAMVALVVPVLALGLPIMDTTFAIIRRWLAGAPIMKPDKGHLHHRLLNLGFSQRQAVLLMYVISAILGSGAIVMTAVSPRTAILILLLIVVAVLYGAKRLGILKLKATR
jgi:UDP-GlcNAc:undecaprenyl-phosphate GlcNAc-1-phosphate transferase